VAPFFGHDPICRLGRFEVGAKFSYLLSLAHFWSVIPRTLICFLFQRFCSICHNALLRMRLRTLLIPASTPSYFVVLQVLAERLATFLPWVPFRDCRYISPETLFPLITLPSNRETFPAGLPPPAGSAPWFKLRIPVVLSLSEDWIQFVLENFTPMFFSKLPLSLLISFQYH